MLSENIVIKRTPSIELLRVLLMYGICLLHCIHAGSGNTAFVESLLLPCVNAFVFISGWFGVRFVPSKVVRLYGVQFYCICVSILFNGRSLSFSEVAKGMSGFWFGHAYVLMMALSPLVNRVIDRIGEHDGLRTAISTCLPLWCAVFLWGYCNRIPGIRLVVPDVHGLDAYSGLTLLATYVGARFFRVLGIDKRVEIRWIFVGFVALIPLIGALHLGTYNSPFAFAFASLIFMMFSKVGMSDSSFISTIVLAVAPSMFSVYFLHMSINAFGDGQVISLSNKNGLDALSITLFVFCECLVLDVPRRLIVAFAYPFLRKVYRTIDNLYEDLVSLIAQKGEP